MKFKFSILVAGALAGLLCIAAGCARVDELDNRVTDLEKKMADLEGTEIASLAQQVQALNAFKDDLTNLDIKGTYSGLLSDMNQAKADIASILANMVNQNDFTALLNTVNGISNDVKKIKDEDIAAILTRLGATESDINAAKSAISGLTEAINSANAKIAALEGTKAEERLAELEKAVGEIGPKVTSLLERVGVAEEKIKANADEIAKIKEGLKKAQEDIAKLDERLSAAEGNISEILTVTIPAIQQRITEQVERLDAAIKDVNTSLADFKKLTYETFATIEAVNSLDLRVVGLETSLKDLTEEVAEHYKQILANAKDIADNKEALQDHLNRIKDLEVKAIEIGGICDELQNQINTINAKFDDYVLNTAFEEFKASVYTKTEVDGQVSEINQKILKNTEDILALSKKVDSIATAHDSSLEKLLGITGGLGEDIEALKKADTVLFKNVKAIWEKLGELKQANIELNTEIDGLKDRVSDLEDADVEFREDLTEAIDSIVALRSDVSGLQADVKALKAVIGVLPEDVKDFAELIALHSTRINAISDSVRAVTERVEGIEGRLVDVEDLLSHRIQSLVYVPDYRDGMITIYTEVLKSGNSTFNLDDVTTDIRYQVKPAKLADTLVNAWTAKTLNVSFDASRVETRGTIAGVIAFDAIKDVKVTDKEKGIITVTVDPNDSTVANGYAKNSAIALVLSDEKGNSRTTEYTNTTTKGGKSYEIVFDYNHTYVPADTVAMPYNKTDVATFFGTVEPLFQLVPKGGSAGDTYYTVAQLKELGHNIVPFVEVKNEVIYPAENETNFVVADDSTTVSVNLIADRSETAKSVGDTLKLIKKMYVKGAADTCRACGCFAVTPISLYAAFSTTVTWNLADDAKGDVFTHVRGNIRNAWKNYGPHKDLAVALDSCNLKAETGFSPAVFSHTEPLPGTLTITKVKGDVSTVLTGAELTAFVISNVKMAPEGDDPHMTLDLQGFDFTADKYVVTAKYLPKYEGVTETKDTTDLTLVINVVDRDRDMIIEHTYPTQTINVTKDFGGKVRIHLQKTGAEFDYFAALLDSLDQDSTLKYADFTGLYNVDTKKYAYALVDEPGQGYDASRLELVCNSADSITFDVKYSAEDIEDVYASGFSIKDTITLGGGQKVAIEVPFDLKWPVFDFKHNEYWVAGDESTGFYSMVKPNYKDKNGTYDIDKLYEFDVFAVDMAQNFSVVDAAGNVVEDLAAKGLTVKHSLVKPYGNITIDNNGKIEYRDSLDYVVAHDSLFFEVAGKKFALRTSFDEGGKYNTYQVRKFEPFKSFTATPVTQKVTEIKDYTVNVLKNYSLIDNRDAIVANKSKALINEEGWITGTGINGFWVDRGADEAYAITEDFIFDVSAIPAEIKNSIEVDDVNGTVTFKYTGQEFLVKDIVIPVQVTVKTIWGSMKAINTITFSKEK